MHCPLLEVLKTTGKGITPYPCREVYYNIVTILYGRSIAGGFTMFSKIEEEKLYTYMCNYDH